MSRSASGEDGRQGLEVGDRVVDRDQPGERRSPAVVVELLDETAEEHVIDKVGLPVSALNDEYAADSAIAKVAFERDLNQNASGWRAVRSHELADRLERCAVTLYAYPIPRLTEYGGDK